MADLDMGRQLKLGTSIAHAQITATTTGSEVDCTGAKEVTIAVYVSANTTSDSTNYVTFTVTNSDATGGTFDAVSSDQYDPVNSWDRVLNATTETGWFVFNFHLTPGHPFIKVVGTETGTTDITYSAHVIERAKDQPQVS